jgi:hypothetical protein
MSYGATCGAMALALFALSATANSVRLERVSGDRQIVLGLQQFDAPIVVRALDGSGAPVSGVQMFVGKVTKFWPGPFLADPFGFRGFNTDFDEFNYSYDVPPEPIYGVSGSDGVVSKFPVVPNPAPSAFPVGVRVLLGMSDTPVQVFFSVVRVAATPPGRPKVIVEFYNAALDHYFITLLDQEVADIDAGRRAGWTRSTGAFIAYESMEDAPVGVVPVCRFFSSRYTSHFYTADPIECEAVISRWPDVWTLETRTAFYAMLPDRQTGACLDRYQPVYRLYTNRSDPNHRYVTDPRLRDVMVANGWVAEGYGQDRAIMCTPR